MIDRYLVDAVTLFRISAKHSGSAFMRSCCRIPEEILFEARRLPDVGALKLLNHPTTTAILDKATIVMATIKPRDKVIDLYSNKGNGDVMLLATALTEVDISETYLIRDRWIIATGDGGLGRKALELAVATCSAEQFISFVARSL